ncbi:hypothetical protein GQ53DRAFT_744126 [Thozetella sp. PMI_491]|nr:hypothetical protein GQ53DRAFT_744126 [Thozetella sp. PMI_491]
MEGAIATSMWLRRPYSFFHVRPRVVGQEKALASLRDEKLPSSAGRCASGSTQSCLRRVQWSLAAIRVSRSPRCAIALLGNSPTANRRLREGAFMAKMGAIATWLLAIAFDFALLAGQARPELRSGQRGHLHLLLALDAKQSMTKVRLVQV